ncbi:MAG: formate dehydrogenase accessory sulfurtransferase FdhD [Rubrivivax sp.]
MMAGDAPLPPPGVRQQTVARWRGGQASPQAQLQADWLAEEVPVALVFNGISHAVMLASPADLEDFALGFAFTEGLVTGPEELLDTELVAVDQGLELRLQVTAACAWRLKDRRRQLAGRTGCGLCGTESLQQVQRELPPVPVAHLSPTALARAQLALRQHQAVAGLTGASHAAAWCSAQGEVLCLREDIGRHNALDKLVGARLRQGATAGPAAEPGFIAITSRASFEMVQKAVFAGASALAAVSAPTSLAVDTARAAGLPLAGFVRGDDFVAYAFPERLGLPPLPSSVG